MARREEGEYSGYLTDEQRGQRRWIGRSGDVRGFETASRLRYADARPGDIRHSVADINRAREILGPDVARVALTDGLRKTLDWAGKLASESH